MEIDSHIKICLLDTIIHQNKLVLHTKEKKKNY